LPKTGFNNIDAVMKDSATQRIRELLWRPRLSESEAAELQSLLAAHPEAQGDYEAETALNNALDCLPEAPAVSSNFTALVLQAVGRETKVRNRTDSRWSLHRWLPKFAVAVLAVTLGIASWHHHEMQEREAMARDVARLGAVLVSSAPELTDNFDTIRRLNVSSPKADTELLTLMQ
jgi:hypothetical protein